MDDSRMAGDILLPVSSDQTILCLTGEQSEETVCNGPRDELPACAPEGTWFTIIKPEPEEVKESVQIEQITDGKPPETESELAKPFCIICRRSFDNIGNLNIHLSQSTDQLHKQYHEQLINHYYQSYHEAALLITTVISDGGNIQDPQRDQQQTTVVTWEKDGQNSPQRETYQCSFCPKICMSRGGLAQHIMRKHEENNTEMSMEVNEQSIPQRGRYQCSFCPMVCTRRSSLGQHILRMHQKNNIQACTNTYECEVCHEVFTSPDVLATHRSHHGQVFTCEFCKKVFKRLSTLKRHQTTGQCPEKQGQQFYEDHSNQVSKQKLSYKCVICQQELQSINNLSIHMKTHIRSEHTYKCEICQRGFISHSTLQCHMKTHSRKSYQCEVCQMKCKTLGGLEMHKLTHSRQEPLYQCEICKKKCVTLGGLKQHMQSHATKSDSEPKSSIEKKYPCESCQEIFSTRVDLTKHMHTHQSRGPLKCSMCDLVFKRPSGLKVHTLFYHQTNKLDLEHQCTMCNRKFAVLAGLKAHMRTVHCKTPADSQTALPLSTSVTEIECGSVAYSCKICWKEFSRSTDLATHLQSHEEQQSQHQCVICQRVFRFSGYLKLHMKLHTKDEQNQSVVSQEDFAKTSCLPSSHSTDMEPCLPEK